MEDVSVNSLRAANDIDRSSLQPAIEVLTWGARRIEPPFSENDHVQKKEGNVMLNVVEPGKFVLTLQSIPPFVVESVFALTLAVLLAVPLILHIQYFLVCISLEYGAFDGV